MIELCETCTKKKKRSDTFDALNAFETELIQLEELCEIMRNLEDRPPRYLYERTAEHVELLRECFRTTWDVVFDKDRGE